jgi:hypothetical protein
MFYFSNYTILAFALTFLIRIAAIALISAFYIKSIESSISIFDGLFLYYPPFEDGGLAHHLLSPTSEAYGGMGALVPIKSSGLTKKDREEFLLSSDLKGILVGLILGDLHIRKQIRSKNPSLIF